MIGFIERLDAVNPVDGPLLQVVLQIATNARPVGYNGDAKFAQPLRWPDAGKLENLGRTDRAGRQDDLAFRANLDRASMLPKSDTYGALAVEQHLLDQNACFKAQVGAMKHRLQEAARRRPAKATLLIHVV